jgi:hypothetical protein
VTKNSQCHGYSIIKKLTVDIPDNKIYCFDFSIKIFEVAASRSNNILRKIHVSTFEEIWEKGIWLHGC